MTFGCPTVEKLRCWSFKFCSDLAHPWQKNDLSRCPNYFSTMLHFLQLAYFEL